MPSIFEQDSKLFLTYTNNRDVMVIETFTRKCGIYDFSYWLKSLQKTTLYAIKCFVFHHQLLLNAKPGQPEMADVVSFHSSTKGDFATRVFLMASYGAPLLKTMILTR